MVKFGCFVKTCLDNIPFQTGW